MITITATASNNSSATTVFRFIPPHFLRRFVSGMPFMLPLGSTLPCFDDVCNEYRGQRHRVRQAEQHRAVEYPGGDPNDNVRHPLQVVYYRSESSFSREATETRSRAAAPSPSLLDSSRLRTT